MATRRTCLGVIALLNEITAKPLSKDAQEVYISCWADVPDAFLELACRQYLAETQEPWYPMPGKLRSLAIMLASPTQMTPAEAWEEAVKCRRSWYPGQERKYHSTEIVEKAIKQVGGISVLWHATDEENISHRVQFMRAYEALLERQQAQGRWIPQVLAVRQIMAGGMAPQINAPEAQKAIDAPPMDDGTEVPADNRLADMVGAIVKRRVM